MHFNPAKLKSVCTEPLQWNRANVTFLSINTSELHAPSKLVIQIASTYNKRLNKFKAQLKYLSVISPLLWERISKKKKKPTVF